MEDVGLPRGATPDPENPGWYSWGDFPRSSFAAATGRLLFKPDGPGRGIARMFPTEDHMNMGGSIHGGAIMSFIDMSMFAGGLCAGMERGHYVTLDLTTHFLARGQAGSPLDSHVELVRQTRGHAFLQGVVKQNGENCYSFSGELKPDPAQARAVEALDRLAAAFRPKGLFSNLFGSRDDGPAGVYLWGGVGRGKSMLMDLAFDHIAIEPKRRVHFHEFMLETHG